MGDTMVTLEFDHLAVAGETLGAAAAHVEATLGTRLSDGGRHARFATWNRLLSLGPAEYLEVIAVHPEAPPPAGARWFGLDGFHGPARLQAWICRVADLDAALAALPEAGQAVDLARGDLRWRMAVPENGLAAWDGLFPALIEWQGPRAADRLAESGCGLRALDLCHPEAGALAARLAPHLDDPRIAFREGRPGLRAWIDTPRGVRQLA
ncbi:VOC family protein [Rhodosalinus sp. 5P4]|uniref:VOC family protein n=1 Tax=Rhodosalinus sp. 5P4 TaxID=3239196 RepID=UPI00352456DC